MGKITDDLLKKVNGGQGAGQDPLVALWGEVARTLNGPLEELKKDPNFAEHAKIILDVLQTNGLGNYNVPAVEAAYQALKGTGPFLTNELALEYLEAVKEYVEFVSKNQ